MSTYRSDKLVQHPDRITQLCRGKHCAPLSVQMVISDSCIHNCRFCSYRTSAVHDDNLFVVRNLQGEVVSKNPSRFISLDKSKEILNDCVRLGVQAIEVTGGGEPTCHPKCAEILQAIRECNLDIGFVSNGVQITEHIIERLVLPGVETWVRVSIDAGREDTYSAIRRCPPSHWTIVWRNIDRLVKDRNATPRSPVVIGISFVVTADNWKEIGLATRIAKDAGVDSIRITCEWPTVDATPLTDKQLHIMDLCKEAKDLETSSFAVIDTFGSRCRDFAQGSPKNATCRYQQLCTYIGADLNVYRCCFHAYAKTGLLGSLQKTTFYDLWEGLKSDQNFIGFDALQCPRCPHASKQLSIADIIKRNRHGNFI